MVLGLAVAHGIFPNAAVGKKDVDRTAWWVHVFLWTFLGERAGKGRYLYHAVSLEDGRTFLDIDGQSKRRR